MKKQIKINPFDSGFANKSYSCGYVGENNAYEFIFEGLTGSDNELWLSENENEYMPVPIPTNTFLVSSYFTQKSVVYTAQIFTKSDNGMIKKGHPFGISVQAGVGGEVTQIEMVPPPFEPKYKQMIAIIDEVQRKLDNGKFDGLSAYELAVQNGFKGTVQEWLESLKYQHSPEFSKLAEQVKLDAKASALNAQNAKTSELQSKKSETNVTEAEKRIDGKVSKFDLDYLNKTETFNKNATEKLQGFDTNAEAKTSEFSKNATEKTNTFNQGVTQANETIDGKVTEVKKDALNAKKDAEQAKKYGERKVIVESPTEPQDKGAIWVEEVGGTNPEAPDYNTLINKPRINGKELMGNVSLEDLDGKYELIEEFAMSEESTFYRSKEPNGTPYKFSKILVQVKFIEKSNNYFRQVAIKSINNKIIVNLPFYPDYNFNYGQALVKDGFWESESFAGNFDNNYTTISKGGYNNQLSNDVQTYPNITQIQSYDKWPVGTLFKIWGVRA